MIVFRVDANENIATGHMMRCIAVAQQIQAAGSRCIFYLAEKKYVERLEENNLPYRILHSKWNNMEEELPVLKKFLEIDCPHWLVVDSYQVSPAYLKELENLVRVLYFDDIGGRRYPVSALLHYTSWSEDSTYMDYYQGSNTVVLAGMKYVPLRAEFYPEEEKKGTRNRVLVTTGGTDLYNAAGALLEAAKMFLELSKFSFEVIVGQLNQHKYKLEQLEKQRENIHLHYDVKNMGEIMRTCDYAVSAGGTTLFELCACQLPTVCFSFAQNQEELAKGMGERQVMIYAGDARYGVEKVAEKMAEGLCRLILENSLAQNMAARMGQLVDGHGARRIADFLMKADL